MLRPGAPLSPGLKFVMRPSAPLSLGLTCWRRPATTQGSHESENFSGEVVATTVAVRDPDDPRLADYARLTDVKLRTSLEAVHGLFVAEGEKVVRRALAAGYPPRSVLITERKLDGLADLLAICPA